ncbi:MAG: H-type lectin domain-containing protein [Oscillospiraceae bacterium]|nr:H-type lectin domain-containing protein [Oscillospiraceae bacterium]
MAENYYYSTLSGEEIENRLIGGVLFNTDQELTTSQKARARANIGAGESNSTFKILGYFDTLEDLQEWLQALPQSGDAYGIGTASPYDVYVYDGIHNTWVNNGPIAYSDALIDDNDISSERTWSSSKINNELGQIDLTALIDDSGTAANKTWSSNKISTDLSGKAPTDHASTATTYGVGNGTNYGHVKLSDTPDANQDVGDGVAATPAAVQSAMDTAMSAMPIVLGGKTGSIACDASAITTYTVSFGNPSPFSSAPNVVACFESYSTAVAFHNVSLAVSNVSTTGFTARIFNGDGSRREPNIRWIAIGN